jgi:hypothetical protein
MNHGGRRDRMGSLITTTYAICAYTLSLRRGVLDTTLCDKACQ